MHSDTLLTSPRWVEGLDNCYFYHTMDLPGIGEVQGDWDLRGKFDEYVGGVDFAGKSVLDVGTATGFLSFEAEKRGANVTSFDMSDARQQSLLPFKDSLYYQDHEQWAKEYGPWMDQWKNAYWLCHRLLKSKASVYYGNIYNLPKELGYFDVAIVGSVLEHLSDQVSALASIARLTKETLVIVTPLLQTKKPIAAFQGSADNPAGNFTWWYYSVGTYTEVLAILGFRISSIRHSKYYHAVVGRWGERSTIVAKRAELDQPLDKALIYNTGSTRPLRRQLPALLRWRSRLPGNRQT